MDCLSEDLLLYICGHLSGLGALHLLSCCRAYRSILPQATKDLMVTIGPASRDIVERLYAEWGRINATLRGPLTLRQCKHFLPHPERLHTLRIWYSRLAENQFCYVIRPFAKTLRELCIMQCPNFGDQSTSTLFRCEQLATLRLSGCLIADRGLRGAAACPALTDLTLHSCCLILDTDLLCLTDCRTLRILRLHRMFVSSDVGTVLVQCARLRELWLSECSRLDDDLALFLTGSESLREVHFSDCSDVSEKSFEVLAARSTIAAVSWRMHHLEFKHTKTVPKDI